MNASPSRPPDRSDVRSINEDKLAERTIRRAIGASIGAITLLGTVSLFSDEGPRSTVGIVVTLALLVSTVPVIVFVARDVDFALPPWVNPSGRWAVFFTVYADIGIAIVLALYSAPEAALFGSVLFVVVSIYAALFARPVVGAAHGVFTCAVTTTFAIQMCAVGDHDVAGVVARLLAIWFTVGGTCGLIMSFSTDIQRSLRTRTDQAQTDPLTGLLNRRGFQIAAADVLESPDAGVLVIDVDHFKTVNDTHGHEVGDDVLRLLARRLQEAVGPSAAVGRTGGEEFAVAVPTDSGSLVRLAQAVLDSLHVPTDAVPITVSIGIAARVATVEPDVAERQDATVRRELAVADSAMYSAKAAGRNRIVQLDASR